MGKYFEDWEEFYDAAIKLFTENPTRTRYVVKYRHVDAKLVIKVTDDRVCLKYKTDQAQDLKKLETLNGSIYKIIIPKVI